MTSIFLCEATEKNLWLLSSLKCHVSGLVDSAFKLTVTATRAAVAELLLPECRRQATVLSWDAVCVHFCNCSAAVSFYAFTLILNTSENS